MAEKSLLANHPVNRFVRNIIDLLDRPEFREKIEALEPEPRTIVRTVEQFSRQIRDQIKVSSDFDVSISGLNQISSNLQNVLNELNAFNSSGNVGNLTNAGANLDGALTSASWSFFKRPIKGSKAYGETIGSVRNAAKAAVDDLRSEAKETLRISAETQDVLGKVSREIGEAKSQIEQLNSASDARLNEIAAEFATIKADIEAERQTDRTAKENDFKDFFKEQTDAAKISTTKITDYEEQAKRILQIVGNIGLTGNFQKRSTDEGSAANFWRWVTVGLFGIGIALITASLVSNIIGQSTINILLIRIAIGIAITLPAIYTAKESGRHRTNSDRAKQIELELASLTPFIEGLPEEDQWRVVSTLTPKYFGAEQVEVHNPQMPSSPEKLLETLAKLADRIPKAG